MDGHCFLNSPTYTVTEIDEHPRVKGMMEIAIEANDDTPDNSAYYLAQTADQAASLAVGDTVEIQLKVTNKPTP